MPFHNADRLPLRHALRSGLRPLLLAWLVAELPGYLAKELAEILQNVVRWLPREELSNTGKSKTSPGVLGDDL